MMAFVQVVETVDVVVAVQVEAFLVYAYPLEIDVDVREVVGHYSLDVDLYHNHSCHAHNHCVVDYYQLVMVVCMAVVVDLVTFSVQVRLIDLIPMLMVDEMELIGHFRVFSSLLVVDDEFVEELELAVGQAWVAALECFVELAVVSFVAEHFLYHSLVLCHMSQLVCVHFYLFVELSSVPQPHHRHHHP